MVLSAQALWLDGASARGQAARRQDRRAVEEAWRRWPECVPTLLRRRPAGRRASAISTASLGGLFARYADVGGGLAPAAARWRRCGGARAHGLAPGGWPNFDPRLPAILAGLDRAGAPRPVGGPATPAPRSPIRDLRARLARLGRAARRRVRRRRRRARTSPRARGAGLAAIDVASLLVWPSFRRVAEPGLERSRRSELEARPRTRSRFFRERFGLDGAALDARLGPALERRVDHADLFFEYTNQDSVVLEEGIVKSGDRHVEQGVGVRVAGRRAPGLRALRRDHPREPASSRRARRARSPRAGGPRARGRGARPRPTGARPLPRGAARRPTSPVRAKVALLSRDRRLRARARPARRAGDGERRLAAAPACWSRRATARSWATSSRWCASTCR